MQQHNPVPDDDGGQTAVSPDTIHGRKIDGDIVGGDKITVGELKNVSGVAIGEGASVTVINYSSDDKEKPKLPFEPDMVLIPSAPFIMGSDVDEPEEAPCHVVNLPDFYIGMYPITNAQFAQFIWKTGRAADGALLWNGNEPAEDKLQHPVTGVTWVEAVAYCAWLAEETGRSYTLPSEAQWEKAARGVNGRLFPWGDEWDSARCNAEYDTLTPVGAFPVQSEYGCCDMVGNGREWTASIWGENSRQPDKIATYPWQDDRRNDLSEPSTTRRIFRGGGAKQPHDFRCTARGGYLPEKRGPKRNRHGFRVARGE